MQLGKRGLGLAARCLALLALGAVGALAQQAYPLRALEFEGNQRFAADDLAAAAGLELGLAVAKGDFDAALRRLNEAGVFERLRYRFEPAGDGYALTIYVEEVAELFPVRFEGFGEPTDAIRDMLRGRLPLYADIAPAGGPMVRMIRNALQGWWAGLGRDERVTGGVVPGDGGEFELLFHPERETHNIAFVTFRNTGDVVSQQLQRTFNQAAVGESYTEARLKELLHHNARPLYTERGYMNVAFCPCEATPDPDSEGLLVEVQVEQGEVYLFGDVKWPAPLPVDPESLRKVNGIHSGQVANMKAAYDTMAAISEGMKRQGYLKAQARFDERVDHEQRRVHLEVRIAPGIRYAFSRLIIEGLDILSEPAVRKRWGMQPGDPFDVRYPAYFLSRIKSDAMFENLQRTSWSIGIDEASGRIDVTLRFSGLAASEEPPPPEELRFPL